MIVPDELFRAFAASSLDDLNQKVLKEREELQDQLWTAGGRPILASIALSLIGLGVILFTDPRSGWVRSLMLMLFVGILVCVYLKRSREALVVREINRLERRFVHRVAVMPIRLGTMPHTTFVATLTTDGDFDLFPVGTERIEVTLRGRLGDVYVVAPPFCIDALAACRLSLDEFEMFLYALACGVGEEFIVPSCVGISEIARLAQFEATTISSN